MSKQIAGGQPTSEQTEDGQQPDSHAFFNAMRDFW